jgi:hypothetical protein
VRPFVVSKKREEANASPAPRWRHPIGQSFYRWSTTLWELGGAPTARTVSVSYELSVSDK